MNGLVDVFIIILQREILAFCLQIATEVPLWLAPALKKSEKCAILFPGWMPIGKFAHSPRSDTIFCAYIQTRSNFRSYRTSGKFVWKKVIRI